MKNTIISNKAMVNCGDMYIYFRNRLTGIENITYLTTRKIYRNLFEAGEKLISWNNTPLKTCNLCFLTAPTCYLAVVNQVPCLSLVRVSLSKQPQRHNFPWKLWKTQNIPKNIRQLKIVESAITIRKEFWHVSLKRCIHRKNQP